MNRPYRQLIESLRHAGLRPTRQRLALARCLFGERHRHLTAEQLHDEVSADVKVSLATVYNALHQFTAAGLLREVVVDPARSYFDTNASNHHHFYAADSGELIDIPPEFVKVSEIPSPPPGTKVTRIDVVIRLAADE